MKFGYMMLGVSLKYQGACAVRAEQRGFESVWLPEHLVMPEVMPDSYPYTADGKPGIVPQTPLFDPWVLISHLAAQTTTLRFGTAVYILPLRHPLVTARALVTLDRLSRGRVILGAGIGWLKEEFDAVGLPFNKRGKLMDEIIPLLRRLWSEEVVKHEGEHYQFGPIRFEPKPTLDTGIPIEIGGSSPPALRRIGAMGDGWVEPGSPDFDGLAEKIKLIKQYRKEAGREHLPFEVTVIANNIFNTPEDVRRAAEIGVTRIVVSPLNSPYSPLTLKGPDYVDFVDRYADAVIDKV
ncbi:MAG: LLM class F420-dependent oxidoreductase [Tissierellales bacterium]